MTSPSSDRRHRVVGCCTHTTGAGDRGRVYDFHWTGPHAVRRDGYRRRWPCGFFRPRTKRVRVSDVPGQHAAGRSDGAVAGPWRVRHAICANAGRLPHQETIRPGRRASTTRRTRVGGRRVGGSPRTMKAARSASRRTRTSCVFGRRFGFIFINVTTRGRTCARGCGGAEDFIVGVSRILYRYCAITVRAYTVW